MILEGIDLATFKRGASAAADRASAHKAKKTARAQTRRADVASAAAAKAKSRVEQSAARTAVVKADPKPVQAKKVGVLGRVAYHASKAKEGYGNLSKNKRTAIKAGAAVAAVGVGALALRKMRQRKREREQRR